MELIIVESPTKARTLSKFLGKEFDVEATTGHLKDLPKSTLGVDVEHGFKPEYIEVEKRKATITLLKSKSKKAGTIYIATDPDREGEAIASHVKELVGNGKSKRISFHEITKEAVEEALKNPRDIDTHLVDAQTARRVLDRLVGYKLSPLLWKKVRRGLSAGRVQTVTVRLIVDREREIEKFKADEYWEIFSQVKSQKAKVKSEFTIQLIRIGEKSAEVKNKVESDKIISDLSNSSYLVSDVRKRQVVKNPYPPFTTSTLQQAAARLMGWSSKKTMSVAQKLYEEGFITYHRTDSLNLAKAAVEKARAFIAKEYGQKYLPETPRFYKTTSKVAQEAHEAIRPTDVTQKLEGSVDKWEKEGERLYDLIRNRFIACQMSASVYDETTIDVEAKYKVQSTKYYLRASGQIMKFDGWRKVIPGVAVEVIALPDVTNDEELDFIKTWGEQKFTQPPARYNEASLIKTLEKLGIGRPSTYAPTISTIQIRQYVEKTEGKFFPTPVGIAVNDFLIANFPDTFDFQFTAGMENMLDEVANGKLEWALEIGKFWNPFVKKLDGVTEKAKRVKIEVEKLGRNCPKCGEGELVIRIGRFGKFISCSRFPDCDHTEKFIEKIGMICPLCKKGEVIIKKTSKGRQFFGCSRYPECKYASWKNPKTPSVEQAS